MSGTFASLLSATFQRLVSPGISPLTWALLICTAVTGVYFDLWHDLPIEPYGQLIQGIARILLGAALLVPMFYAHWRLTRDVADVQGRDGAVWPWLGWTFLAYLPVIVPAAAFAFRASEFRQTDILAEAMLIAALPAVLAPLLVHASGCAIDAANSNAARVWNAWKSGYLALAMAYAALTVPFALLSELALLNAGEGVIPSMLSAVLYLPASIFSTLLTVEAFHRVPQKAHG